MTYQIDVRISARYRRDVRRQLQETGLNYTEQRRWTASTFTLRTECRDLYEILQEWFTETDRTVYSK